MSEMEIIVLSGDITEIKASAIVNPANSLGVMGGGVAGVLRQKGGKVIEDEAKKASPIKIGESIVTTSGTLSASYVIHAPTMSKPSEKTNVENVKKALISALHAAEEKQLESLAIPGMGTGVGKVPFEESAQAIISVLLGFDAIHLKKVYLVDLNDRMTAAFEKAKAAYLQNGGESASNP